MSSNTRNAEKRRENEAAYERDCNQRATHRSYMLEKYGFMLKRLHDLGIDIDLLQEYLEEPNP